MQFAKNSKGTLRIFPHGGWSRTMAQVKLSVQRYSKSRKKESMIILNTHPGPVRLHNVTIGLVGWHNNRTPGWDYLHLKMEGLTIYWGYFVGRLSLSQLSSRGCMGVWLNWIRCHQIEGGIKQSDAPRRGFYSIMHPIHPQFKDGNDRFVPSITSGFTDFVSIYRNHPSSRVLSRPDHHGNSIKTLLKNIIFLPSSSSLTTSKRMYFDEIVAVRPYQSTGAAWRESKEVAEGGAWRKHEWNEYLWWRPQLDFPLILINEISLTLTRYATMMEPNIRHPSTWLSIGRHKIISVLEIKWSGAERIMNCTTWCCSSGDQFLPFSFLHLLLW